jgi:hypothetical protein
MTPIEATFHETSAQPRVEGVPYAHLSIALGHLYMEDYAGGLDGLRAHFRQVAPWAAAARDSCAAALGGRRARISTCFLVDDYFTPFGSPRTIIPELRTAADDCGLRIDYLARESGCADAGGVPLAELVEGLLVAEPPPQTTGGRPPVTETGWLSNGERSPAGTLEAMGSPQPWAPPMENAANRHSIFLDVELWNGRPEGGRTWSCPYLAAVWQLLRLGMVRDLGRPVGQPVEWTGELPDEWIDLPPLVQLTPGAAPFSAYRTFSVLAGRYLPIEHAVRLVLNQVAPERRVSEQAIERSRAEDIALPAELVDRIDYVFLSNVS